MDFFVNFSPAMYTALFDFKSEDWERQAAKIFPRMAKCDLVKFGPSGTQQIEDALCILAMNIVNEKLFGFIWIWFLVLVCISGLNLLYKTIVWSCSSYRVRVLVAQTNLRSSVIRLVTDDGCFGKWFVLYKLSRNVNPVSFDELLIEIAKKIKKNMRTYEKRDLDRDTDVEEDIA